MAKPCAVFWDIQNGTLPGKGSAKSIVKQIRSDIIKPYNLNEIFFFCACDVESLPKNVAASLIDLDVDIVQAQHLYATGDKIINLMRKFVKLAGQDCTIILLGCDADCYGTLSELKNLYNVSIHLIGLDSFLPEPDQISDYTFMLNDGVLKRIVSTNLPLYFISVKNYPLTSTMGNDHKLMISHRLYPENMRINFVMATLNSQIANSIQNSAILFYDSICIGFPSLYDAAKAVEQLNKSLFHGHSYKAERIEDSPLTEILKCIKPNIMTTKTISNNEVKQLTFIKMNNSNEADDSKTIKFYIACTQQSGCQCILARESFSLKESCWLVFSRKSDAQDCLSKIELMYPDAIISEPPFDLTSNHQETPYTVEYCEQKVSIEATSGVDNAVKPVTLKETMNSEPREVSDTNVRDGNGWNIFFRCDFYYISDRLEYRPTKWTLLYTLYEQLCDLGVKKVISDGNLYCAHFDSVSTYQDALSEKYWRYLEPLEFVHAQDLNKKFKKKMDRYMHEIPWCLNSELGIHCLLLTPQKNYPMRQDFKELFKEMLANMCECIFIKSVLDEYWIGFADEFSCKHYQEKVLSFFARHGYDKHTMDNSNLYPYAWGIIEPSQELLESIDLHDLVGDAYDLAFLSSQLESSKPIAKPSIIERTRFLRAEEQICNEYVPHVTLKALFCTFQKLYNIAFSIEQIVKIIVNFSKVIPAAATASDDEVKLIFNSRYEKETACYFIHKYLLYISMHDGAPYFPNFHLATERFGEKIKFTSNFTYYVINDKRKVLEKIVRNENLMDRQHSNLSTTESTSNFGLTDEVTKKKYFYNIIFLTGSCFKFTSGMIAIIKLNLAQMDCPACIEFEDKIWVAVDDFEKGEKAKANINKIKFKILHEKDDGEYFQVEVLMQSAHSIPTEVDKMLSNRLIGPKSKFYEAGIPRPFWIPTDVPLGHFNYNCRKAATRQSIAPPIYYFQGEKLSVNNLYKREKKKKKKKNKRY